MPQLHKHLIVRRNSFLPDEEDNTDNFFKYNSTLFSASKPWVKDRDKPTFADVVAKPTKLSYTFKSDLAKRLSDKAWTEWKWKKYRKAIDLLQTAIKTEPTNPSLYFDIANCYSALDKFEEAVVYLNSAVKLDSMCYSFYNNRGLNYYKLSNNAKAISDYQRALQLNSTKALVYMNLALAYYSKHDESNACSALRKAQSLGLDVNELGAEVAESLEKTCR